MYWLIGIIVIIVLLIVLRHSKINYYKMLFLELVDDDCFSSSQIRCFLEKKVVTLEYKLSFRNKFDHPFLKDLLIEEYKLYKSLLIEKNAIIELNDKKDILKTLIISEMLNHPLING